MRHLGTSVPVACLLLACGPQPSLQSPTPAATTSPPGSVQPGAEQPAPSAGPATGLWAPRKVDGYDPRAAMVVATIAAQPWDGDDLGSAHYRDVMTHTGAEHRFTSADAGPTTIGHETHHGLQWERRRWSEPQAAFFYFARGFGTFVESPRLSERLLRTEADGTPVYTADAHTNAAHVRDFLPAGAKQHAAGRYQTYLLDATHATQGVLYLFDEWNAYLASARMAIELERAGYYQRTADSGTRTDALDGMVDFLYFSSAGLLALDQREPGYVAGSAALRALYGAFAEETVELLVDGGELRRFQGFHAHLLMEHFKSSTENEPIRRRLRSWLGAPWCQRVFGF